MSAGSPAVTSDSISCSWSGTPEASLGDGRGLVTVIHVCAVKVDMVEHTSQGEAPASEKRNLKREEINLGQFSFPFPFFFFKSSVVGSSAPTTSTLFLLEERHQTLL